MRHSVTFQNGAVLVVSLILLTIMTLLGLGAMQNTFLEEKMAGNAWFSQQAFQAAERGLRAGEGAIFAEVTSATAFDFSKDDGFYPAIGNIDPVQHDWTFTYDPKGFVVEYMGCRDLSGNSAKLGPNQCQSGASEYLFRVWGRGEQGNALRILQTHYATDSPL